MEVKKILLDAYKITYELLGPDDKKSKNVQEVRILNRIIRSTSEGIKMEADPRHAEKILAHYDMKDCTATKVPGVKAPKKEDSEEASGLEDLDEIELEGREATEHRGVAARLNYLVSDRADIQFATKELARTMSRPTRGDTQKGKRIARYLQGRPRVVLNFDWCDPISELKAYSDSDWAGCVASRKSTSGGVMSGGYRVVRFLFNQVSAAIFWVVFFAAHKSGEKRQGTAEDRDDLSLSAERVSKFSALGKANNAGGFNAIRLRNARHPRTRRHVFSL